jgi:hypothetical protein
LVYTLPLIQVGVTLSLGLLEKVALKLRLESLLKVVTPSHQLTCAISNRHGSSTKG